MPRIIAISWLWCVHVSSGENVELTYQARKLKQEANVKKIFHKLGTTIQSYGANSVLYTDTSLAT